MAGVARVDAAVVGGGPAGALAARRLAAAGASVRLFEARTLPRYKTCGGGLVGRARRWLDLDLGAVVEGECRLAEMRFLDQDLCFRLRHEEPVVTMTMRAALDHRLLEAAADAGAVVQAPSAVIGLERTSSGVRLRTDGGPLDARFVVAADGAAGRVARWAGWRREPPRAAAIESELRVDRRTWELFGDRAVFDFGLIPHGYAWVFPKRRHLSVGCLTTRPGRRKLRPALDAYLLRLGIAPAARDDHGFVIPLAPRAPDLVRGLVLLAGDAAGLADPITAEGISYAALSGTLAAEAIVEGGGEPGRVARIYQRRLRRDILGELSAARPLARLLYERPRVSRFVFRRGGEPLCRAIGEILAGRTTYRQLATSPRNYLRLARRLIRGATES